MASFHNWTGDEEIDKQVPQFLNEDNAATQEKLNAKFNKSYHLAKASDLNSIRNEGFYTCGSNNDAETMLNCPTEYAFGLMVWGTGEIVYQEVREYNRSSKNQDNNNCWRRSYYSSGNVQNTWSNWQKMAYTATTLAGYGITDGMRKDVTNRVSVEDIVQMDVNTTYLSILGGNSFDKCASFQLYGGESTSNTGQFVLRAKDLTHSVDFFGSPSGILKWDAKNIVRSVNNFGADNKGNVAIPVDTAMSSTSTNPVQNKVIYDALLGKVDNDILNGFALIGATSMITWRQGTQFVGSINATNYTGTALAAIRDGEKNVIADTYAKKTELTAFGALNDANTWTVQQTFNDVVLNREKYTTYVVANTSDKPITSTMVYAVTSAFTLDLSVLAGALSASQSSIFTAYFAANADYSLTISNAGKLKYVGSASDVAITSAGLLLNIWMSKDGGGTLTSIVQASKLS